MSRSLLILVSAFPAAMFAQQAVDAPATPVGGYNLVHAVHSLDKTVPFYRDLLGLQLDGSEDPLARKPQPLDAYRSLLMATPGASWRSALFWIPGANFGLGLREFTGVERKAYRLNLQDPGAATLALMVRDIDKVVARLKAAGTTIVTSGGAPINPTGNSNSKMREIIVRDPDGFFVELQQPDPVPAGALAQGDILGGSIQLSIADTGNSVQFYHATIGFDARPSSPWGTNETVLKLIGLPWAQWRITHGKISGYAGNVAFIEYKGVPRQEYKGVPQQYKGVPRQEYKGVPRRSRMMSTADPGCPSFVMPVSDLDVALREWKAAGGTVVSTGGTWVQGPGGEGSVLVRDINGFLWEFYRVQVVRL